jgi:hypothetical protein
MGKNRKKVAVVYSEVLSKNMPEGTDEKYKKHKSDSWPTATNRAETIQTH